MSYVLSTPDRAICHKVKACCVQLHASVQKWKQLTEKGFGIANKLANTCLYEKYTQCSEDFQTKFDIASLEAKIIKEREDLYTALKVIQEDLMKTVEKMGTLTSNIHAAMELIIIQRRSLNQPVYQTLSPAQLSSCCEAVFKAHSQELSLREKIVGDILKQSNRDTITLYLSCWLHEPYIGCECVEKLEALLLETELR